MSKKIIHVPSLLVPVQNLFASFPERLVQLEAHPRQFTSFGMSISHRDHLQDLGILPDRHYPSTASLDKEPLLVRFDLFHPYDTLSIYRNGTLTAYLHGSLVPRKHSIGLSLGYPSPHNWRNLHDGLSPQQRHLHCVAEATLERLLLQETVLI